MSEVERPKEEGEIYRKDQGYQYSENMQLMMRRMKMESNQLGVHLSAFPGFTLKFPENELNSAEDLQRIFTGSGVSMLRKEKRIG